MPSSPFLVSSSYSSTLFHSFTSHRINSYFGIPFPLLLLHLPHLLHLLPTSSIPFTLPMNPPYDFAPASSPSTQKPFSRTNNSPSVARPDESPGSGRQRVKTEPSPRHQHTPHASSGWLGPYNEPSPTPGSKSPRARLGHSPAATDTRGGGGGLSDRNYYDRHDASRIQGHGVQDTHKALGWQLDSSPRPGSMSTSFGHVEGSGFRRRDFDPRQGHDSSGIAGPSMEPSSSVQSLVESIDDDHVLKLTEMTKKRVEHSNPTQKRQRVVSLPASEAALGKGWIE